jgi:hypothetical protein
VIAFERATEQPDNKKAPKNHEYASAFIFVNRRAPWCWVSEGCSAVLSFSPVGLVMGWRVPSPQRRYLTGGTCDEMPCFSRLRAAPRAILANSSWRACIVSVDVQIDNAAITRSSRS